MAAKENTKTDVYKRQVLQGAEKRALGRNFRKAGMPVEKRPEFLSPADRHESSPHRISI